MSKSRKSNCLYSAVSQQYTLLENLTEAAAYESAQFAAYLSEHRSWLPVSLRLHDVVYHTMELIKDAQCDSLDTFIENNNAKRIHQRARKKSTNNAN